MCFGSSPAPAATPVTPPAEAAAIASQKKYREERANRSTAYDGFATDIIGSGVAKGTANDNTAPSNAALKKLMGA